MKLVTKKVLRIMPFKSYSYFGLLLATLSMPLKYEKQIGVFPCDMSKFKEVDKRTCFRWVFEDIKDDRNFRPVYDLDGVPDENAHCKGWALSLFASKKQAIDRFNVRLKSKPLFYTKVGSFVAKGELAKEHGISDPEAKYGHFSLFEYERVDLVPIFTIEERIYTPNA